MYIAVAGRCLSDFRLSVFLIFFLYLSVDILLEPLILFHFSSTIIAVAVIVFVIVFDNLDVAVCLFVCGLTLEQSLSLFVDYLVLLFLTIVSCTSTSLFPCLSAVCWYCFTFQDLAVCRSLLACGAFRFPFHCCFCRLGRVLARVPGAAHYNFPLHHSFPVLHV